MNATLRAAGPGDLELFAALEAEVFSEDPWTPYMIAEELSSPASRYWIATDDSGDARSSSMCAPRTRVPSTCTRHGDSSKLAADRATFATPSKRPSR